MASNRKIPGCDNPDCEDPLVYYVEEHWYAANLDEDEQPVEKGRPVHREQRWQCTACGTCWYAYPVDDDGSGGE